MTSILRQMTDSHYQRYIDHFPTTIDLTDFLMEILMVFRNLVNSNVFPNDWNEMIMLQNRYCFKILRSLIINLGNFQYLFNWKSWMNYSFIMNLFKIIMWHLMYVLFLSYFNNSIYGLFLLQCVSWCLKAIFWNNSK